MSQESILGPYLKPGTPIKVGAYSTRIIRYLSEGGFSHVYTAKLDIPVKGSDVAVLKRIVAPDKHTLAAIRTEVETMKKLKGHRYIVTYIDSHASALSSGGFEVYVLMEYCPGGGLIDFMNTRLQTRLAEWEVLKIISDTTEAVACMHYLRPPLLHRDLKIENVLISGNGDYKLCDFGSCTEPRPAATNSQERRELEEDIQKNTTIQYRSPEMVDVNRRLPIDEKSDIWALGVLLYKLCYFTTPFEAQGQLAILNAAYTFPPYPPYTDRTKRLIAVTLQENPRDRPNIYQLLAEICAMRNVAIPIPDIYSKSRSNSRTSQSRPSSRPPTTHNEDILTYDVAAAAAIGATTSTLAVADTTAREAMRRGRPEKVAVVSQADVEAPSRSRHSSRPASAKTQPLVDEHEFSTKFPSLEEMNFSLEPEIPSNSPAVEQMPASSPHTQSVVRDRVEVAAAKSESMDTTDYGRSRKGNDGREARPLPLPPSTSAPDDVAFEERTMRPSEVGKNGTFLRNVTSLPNQEAHNRIDHTALKTVEKQTIADVDTLPGSNPIAILPNDAFRPDRQQAKDVNMKSSSNPYDQVPGFADRIKSRPNMVSRSSQTSPKPKQAVQTQTSPIKKLDLGATSIPGASLSDNLMRDSSGLIITKPVPRREGQETAPKPQFKYRTSVDTSNQASRAQEQSQRAKLPGYTRPQTIHAESSSDFLTQFESQNRSRPQIAINRTGSSLDSDLGNKKAIDPTYLTADNEQAGASLRRSVSVSLANARHTKRPSINHIPSFSGAAKNIMSGKFGDAFKKFESSVKAKGNTPSSERSNPLQVAENDLPDHITQHLQSTEARRSSSYSRNRPSFEVSARPEHPISIQEKSTNIESNSSSVKDALRRLTEKASQPYVPQRSAQGYGKYTEPDGLTRAATVIPYSRTVTTEDRLPSVQKPVAYQGKNARRYGLKDEDEDRDSSTFSKRYPSLSDFKV